VYRKDEFNLALQNAKNKKNTKRRTEETKKLKRTKWKKQAVSGLCNWLTREVDVLWKMVPLTKSIMLFLLSKRQARWINITSNVPAFNSVT